MSWEPTGALPDPATVPPGMRNPGGFGLPADGDVIAWAAYPAGGQGESGQLTWRSSDGGLTWAIQAKKSDQNLTGVFFLGAAQGWVTGTNGVLLKTLDGGF